MTDNDLESPALLEEDPRAGREAYSEWFGEFVGRRILVLEDTAVHAWQVESVLRAAGCEHIDVFDTGARALKAAEETRYDFLLLDIGVDDISGIEVLRRIRAGRGPNHDALTFFLTVSGDHRTRRQVVSKSADVRADGFLVKPVLDGELIAQIGEKLEANDLKEEVTVFENGPLRLETSPYAAKIGGQPLKLSAKREALFVLLMRNCGRPVTRQMIAIACWKNDWAANGYEIDRCRDDSISALIHQLRLALRAQAPDSFKDAMDKLLTAVPHEGLVMNRL